MEHLILDLAPLQTHERRELPFSVSFPLEDCADLTGSAVFAGQCTDHSGYLLLNAVLTVRGQAVCARCAKEFPAEFQYPVTYPLAEQQDIRAERDIGEEEYLPLTHGKLDLTATAQDALLLELPSRYLCREDCKGLCPQCGADLNEGDCGCDRRTIDPRLEPLREFLKKKKS